MARTWKWLVAALAALTAFTLPALQLTVPLVPAHSWTIFQLAASAAQLARHRQTPQPGDVNLGSTLQQARRLLQSVTHKQGAAGLKRALALAAAIPAAALLAGVCALLSLLAVGLARAWIERWIAAIGLAAAAYAVGASWWLTHQVHVLLTPWLGLSALVSGFALEPEAAPYVLILLFAAMLLWPAPGSPDPAEVSGA